jgi:hypothetical protein
MNVAKGRIVLAVLAVFLGFSPEAWADFSFKPGIAVREEYNDNIFLTSTGKKSDFITTVNPTLNLSYSGDLMNLYLDYGFRYLLYAGGTEADKLYNNVNFQSTLRPLKDYVFINVSDFFSRVPIDDRRQVGYENNLSNLTNSNSFSVNPYVVYPISPTFRVTGGYTYQNIWYESKEGNDSQDHTASLNITKDLTSRTTVSLLYQYLFHRPTLEANGYDRQNAGVSLTIGITEKMKFEGTVGWISFAYKRMDRRDFDAINWSATGRYQLSPALSLHAGYSRNYNDSYSQTGQTSGIFTSPSQGIIYPGESFIIVDGQPIPTSAVVLDSINGGLYRSDIITGGLTYSGKIPFTVTGYGNTDKYMNIYRENRTTGVNMTASIPLTSKLTALVNGFYSYNKYLPENEKVNRYGARLAIEYALKITTLTLGYAFNREDSNIDLSDYTNNIVWIGARFVF